MLGYFFVVFGIALPRHYLICKTCFSTSVFTQENQDDPQDIKHRSTNCRNC